MSHSTIQERMEALRQRSNHLEAEAEARRQRCEQRHTLGGQLVRQVHQEVASLEGLSTPRGTIHLKEDIGSGTYRSRLLIMARSSSISSHTLTSVEVEIDENLQPHWSCDRVAIATDQLLALIVATVEATFAGSDGTGSDTAAPCTHSSPTDQDLLEIDPEDGSKRYGCRQCGAIYIEPNE